MIDDILHGIVTWEPVPFVGDATSAGAHITHRGILRIGDCAVAIVQWSNGERTFTEESRKQFFGLLTPPPGA
jgi:hypothetical protein